MNGGGLVYLLCFATAAACAGLLLRRWRETAVRLLLWTGVCFVGLALNNLLLFIDLAVVPASDLSVWRLLPSLAGMAVLLFGMIWETR